jgi:virulence-associated protein VagC
METAKLFKNGDSQAVILPKEFQFQGFLLDTNICIYIIKQKSPRLIVGSIQKFWVTTEPSPVQRY